MDYEDVQQKIVKIIESVERIEVLEYLYTFIRLFLEVWK